MNGQNSKDPVISLNRVSKAFRGDVVALNDVSLQVPEGEILALLGSSGAGKSTLLRHICGLHKPTTGAISVLGTDIVAAKERAMRRLRCRIGFIFQQFNLVEQLSVLENVCSGALGRLKGPRLGLFTYSSRLRKEALEHLDRVGMAEQAFQRAGTLSGGQQQRVAIARVLMQHPVIILADEPVASLDPDSTDIVMRLLREIVRDKGVTLIGSLHQTGLALSWADRIVGLQQGAVVLDRPTCLLSTDTVMEIYGSATSSR